MPVAPEMQAYLDRVAAAGEPPYGTLPVEEHRRLFEEAAPLGFGEVAPVPFEERTIPGPEGPIPARVYRPALAADEAPAALVYFHGGGWVLGSPRTHHSVTATLARETPCVVVSVDYRCAPEHPFPAANEDAWAAVEWTALHAEELGARPGALAVGGDSAGGHLAAIVARRARDHGLPLALQLLVYPVTDAACATESYDTCSTGYGLTRDSMLWFWSMYLPEGDRLRPEASPLLAEDLTRVAPALVLTAEYDPLRDEGEAYARKLEAAGVPVTLRRYEGQIHGFLRMTGVTEDARDALLGAARALRAAFASPVPA